MAGRRQHMPLTVTSRRRLAEAMEERRRELGLRWQDIAEAGSRSILSANQWTCSFFY